MIRLINGGDFAKKGYYYSFYITLPEFSNSKTINMFGSEHKCLKISFPSKFMLTTNSIYFNIVTRLFGFGLGLEIQSKS